MDNADSKENQDYTFKTLLSNIFNAIVNMKQKIRERIFQNGTEFFVLGGVYSIRLIIKQM